MEHIIKQPPIIRLPHLGLIVLGIILVILALISEPYILHNRSGIIVVAIALGLLMVELRLTYYHYTFDDIQKDQAKQLVKKE